jgi:hypothetical protein
MDALSETFKYSETNYSLSSATVRGSSSLYDLGRFDHQWPRGEVLPALFARSVGYEPGSQEEHYESKIYL